MSIDRRSVLRTVCGLAVAATVPPLVLAPASAVAAPMGGVARRIALHNVNTRDLFDGVYWSNGAYVPEALRKLDVLLRDHRANQVCRFDPKLFDILWQVQQRLGASEPYEVICGFRSNRTNALARRRSRGVAKESFHTRGMAVDVHIPGYDLRGVAREAIGLGAGGVGTYLRSGFVHMDSGPVRTW